MTTQQIEIGFIQFTCPLCGQHLHAATDDVGHDVTCHGCNCAVTVPEETNGQARKLAAVVPQHAEPATPTCVLCKSEKTVEFRHPNRNTGIIMMILGLILTPVIIGLPFLLWGIDMFRFREDWWRCSGCGAATPITKANCPDGWKPPTFVPTWALIAFTLLCLLFVGSGALHFAMK
jgi:hypothetical protein